jgi:hypothetical protein
MAAMTESVFTGSCHCGAVRFEVRMATPEKVYACNCSICSRAGWLLTFVEGDAFRLLAGEASLTDYQFGKRHLHHTFCSVCGVRPFSRGAGEGGALTTAINVRCLAGLDLTKVPVESFDGASL